MADFSGKHHELRWRAMIALATIVSMTMFWRAVIHLLLAPA